ncbi:hypothetical protein ACFE04_031866 [Oxalis oulophora]
MDEVSLNSEPIGNVDADGFEVEGDSEMSEFVNQSGEIQGENPLPPVVGMEFESYEDVYYFYNCYAKEQGFDVRVSYTCCRKNKERYRGKLSCSSAGFKRKKETSRARPETRTGCPAMIKTSLMENKRWRIVEVQIDHNHFISKTNRKVCNSNIKVRSGTKRTMQPDQGDNVRIFRTVIIDAEGDSSTVNVDEVDSGNTLPHSSQSNHVNVDAEEDSSTPGEFESAWKDIVQRYGIRDDEWVQTFYEERKRCLPLEALSDVESRNLTFSPKSSYEIQLSKIYTNNILRRFGKEVESMYSCYSTQLTTDGPVITYRVKEKTDLGNHHQTDTRDFEVLYNASEKEVVCVCGLFNLRGYLCRHALRVLHLNGIDEIPPQYILTRWRKDVKRKYVLNQSSGGIDVNNTLHRYEHLYRRIVQVVEEGTKSDDRCETALEGLEEILGKLGLVEGSSTASVRK